jgi:hypothetical protein
MKKTVAYRFPGQYKTLRGTLVKREGIPGIVCLAASPEVVEIIALALNEQANAKFIAACQIAEEVNRERSH